MPANLCQLTPTACPRMRPVRLSGLVAAICLAVFLQPPAFSQRPSPPYRRQSTTGETISIIRVKDDLMVKWFCPDFRKTSLMVLNGDEEWEAMDGAATPVPETQYSTVPRELQKGFFRTSTEELQEFPPLRIMMPRHFISALPTPLRVEVVRTDGQVDWEVWDDQIWVDIANLLMPSQPLNLHNGVASGLLSVPVQGETYITLHYGSISVQKTLSSLDVSGRVQVAGELSEPLTVWKPGDGIIHVTDNVTLPAGNTLRIYPDTMILLDPKKSVTVRGTVESLGTVEHPVLFSAADPQRPWGEISHSGTSTKSTYRGTFFIGGGDSPQAGHTDKGPVIRFNNAAIEFDHCNFMDNYGKGLYGNRGELTFTSCVFSRCEMGMEVVNTDIVIDRCFFIEMPPGGDVADRDALYLNGQGNMSVTNTIFAVGGDDGIDTLSSAPVIENCVIHGFEDKGISIFYGAPRVKNCLILSNAYGISAKGDGTNVYVDNVTILNNTNQTHNGAGLRSHNKYNDPDAAIKYFVTSSIIWDNDQAIRTDYPLEHISITYSDVQGDGLFPGIGNIASDPLFFNSDGNDFRLGENSPCRGAGQNGTDMGCLYTSLP